MSSEGPFLPKPFCDLHRCSMTPKPAFSLYPAGCLCSLPVPEDDAQHCRNNTALHLSCKLKVMGTLDIPSSRSACYLSFALGVFPASPVLMGWPSGLRSTSTYTAQPLPASLRLPAWQDWLPLGEGCARAANELRKAATSEPKAQAKAPCSLIQVACSCAICLPPVTNPGRVKPEELCGSAPGING